MTLGPNGSIETPAGITPATAQPLALASSDLTRSRTARREVPIAPAPTRTDERTEVAPESSPDEDPPTRDNDGEDDSTDPVLVLDVVEADGTHVHVTEVGALSWCGDAIPRIEAIAHLQELRFDRGPYDETIAAAELRAWWKARESG